MKKVLFVCYGNICRSPMAEYYFRHLVEKDGLSDRITVASAAVSNEEVGNPIYPLAKRMLATKGIGCKDKTARQITKSDYDEFDYIVVMDAANKKDACGMWGGDPCGKISLLLDHCAPSHPRHGYDVADPWYTRRFDIAFDDITLGCNALLKNIMNGKMEIYSNNFPLVF